jgi:sirohydrochlorin ferrochelatase
LRREPTHESPRAEKSAALLIAHGSRRPEANRDLVDLAFAIRGRTHYPIVDVAYLEVVEPTIPQAARGCVEQGATRVSLLPYFLSAGAHVVEDLERIRADLALEFPAVRFVLCKPLSLHPLLIDIVVDRLKEAETAEAG